MKKKYLIPALCICLGLLGLTGCGNGADKTAGSAANETGQVSIQAEASAPSEEAAGEASALAEASAGPEESNEAASGQTLADGTYVATFTTSHAMFHVNEANNNKGILTVKDGQMTIHVSLQSKKIVNLFYGKAEDAKKEGAKLIEPTIDTVTYEDGMTSQVYGFDVPVPAIDQEFDVAIIGTHGNWYDHTVVVSDPIEGDDIHAGTQIDLEDGQYSVSIEMTGGTGKATVESPAAMTVKDGAATLTLAWSSPYFDYMVVAGEKYLPVNDEGNSVFEIPVKRINEPFTVTADTTAMSEPHEIDYKLTLTLLDE